MGKAYRSGKGDAFAILDFTIAIDVQEKLPWRFTGFKCDSPHSDKDLVIPTKIQHLRTGDYSIVSMEDRVTIERKSLADLYGTLGNNRERFARELERMREFEFRALVIEATWLTLSTSPPEHSGMNPKSVFRSLIAIAQRYNVHVYDAPTPVFAERIAFRILERFWRDRLPGGYYGAEDPRRTLEGLSQGHTG